MTRGLKIFFSVPLKKKGEDCGSCFCPPKFFAGECAQGLFCDTSIQKQIPDLPGICRQAGEKLKTLTSGAIFVY